MIQKSAANSKSVDFHRQSISGCLYEQPGRHPLSGNMCLNLKNHGLDECQGDSDSGKVHPRESQCSSRFLVQKDKVVQTKGAMNHQVFNQISHCWHQSVVDVFPTKLNHKLPMYVSCQAWETEALSVSWNGLDGHVFCPVALVMQKMITCRCRIIMIASG